MRCISFILLILFSTTWQSANAQLDNFFQKTDQFLEKHVDDGLVHYNAIKEDPETLNQLTEMIGEAKKPREAPVRKAFYINAYNILAIKNIIDHYPVDGPKSIDGFFDGISNQVHEQTMTLDKLEKEILFEEFPDDRVHFAVICAAKGCPPMMDGAYFPEKLNAQLDKQTKKALSDKDFVRFDKQGRLVRLSQIMKWYKDDFLNEANSLIDYLNQYRDNRLPADTRTTFYDYDWSLNKKKSK